jgi:small redox-active disulfide protein 2
MKIEIIGNGCPKCYETERRIHRALAESRQNAEVVHFTDPREVARRGFIVTPAVLVDGVMRLAGRVPGVEEVKLWLNHS